MERKRWWLKWNGLLINRYMTNKTLIIIRELREDISEYLFHFTKGNDAFETLQKILDEGKLRSFNEEKYICFTETPITMLGSFFNYVERTFSTPTIIAPYGIGIRKDVLFKKGARSVIYGTREEKKLLPKINMLYPNYSKDKVLLEGKLAHNALFEYIRGIVENDNKNKQSSYL